MGNQRVDVSADLDDAAIDAGSGPEPQEGTLPCRVKATQGEVLRGQHGGAAHPAAFARDLPLREEHRLAPGADAEKSAHGRGSEVERDVPHDHRVVERNSECIGVLHRHAGQGIPECCYSVLVDVDRGQRPAEPGERSGECSVSGTEFEDRPSGCCIAVPRREVFRMDDARSVQRGAPSGAAAAGHADVDACRADDQEVSSLRRLP